MTVRLGLKSYSTAGVILDCSCLSEVILHYSINSSKNNSKDLEMTKGTECWILQISAFA
jgi:hypothetical protein